MTGYATPDDVINEYEGTIPSDRVDYVAQKLQSATTVLLARVKSGGYASIAALITAGRTDADSVRLVLCNMVCRILRNPQGFRTQTAGPFSTTVDAQVSSGRVFVSREDLRLLGLRAGAGNVTVDDPALPYVTQPVPGTGYWRTASGVPIL